MVNLSLDMEKWPPLPEAEVGEPSGEVDIGGLVNDATESGAYRFLGAGSIVIYTCATDLEADGPYFD